MEYLFIALILLTVPVGLVWAIVQLVELRRRITLLEIELEGLRSVARRESSQQPAQAAPRMSPDAALHPPEDRPAATPLPPPPPARETPVYKAPSAPAPTERVPDLMRPSGSTGSTGMTQREWESLVGGKLLNRIGALAIIIGVGFFLKYAFDNNWISPAVRVLMGIVAGAGLLVLGKIMHGREYKVFAQGIVGAGIAILYLSMYASFNFYSLVSQQVAFIGMGVVTAVAIWRGLRHDSLAIGILGWLGGFLTPFLLATDVVNDVGFLVYVGLLAAGVRVISVWRPAWKLLGYLAFVGCAIHYWGWFDAYYTIEKALTATVAILAYWGIFLVTEPISIVRQQVGDRVANYALAAVHAAMWLLALYVALDERYRYAAAAVVLGMSAVYVAIGFLWGRRATCDRNLVEQYFIQAVAFLAASTAIALSEYQQVMALAGEAAVLAWVANRRNVTAFRFAIFGLMAVSFFRFLFIAGMARFEPIASFQLLINERALALLSLAVALVLGSRWLHKKNDRYGETIGMTLSALWCLSIFLLITFETLDYFRFLASTGRDLPLATSHELTTNMTLALAWTVLAGTLLTLGVRSRAQVMIVAGFLVLEIGLVWTLMTGWSYAPDTVYTPLFNYRAVVVILVGLMLYWSSRLCAQIGDIGSPFDKFEAAIRVCLVVLGLFFLTVEVWDIFDRTRELTRLSSGLTTERLKSILNSQQLALSAVWLVYSVIMMTLGIWKRTRPLRLAAFALFGITILKIFLRDLTFLTGLYRILSFIGLGVILLGVSYAYQRYKVLIFGEDEATRPNATS